MHVAVDNAGYNPPPRSIEVRLCRRKVRAECLNLSATYAQIRYRIRPIFPIDDATVSNT